MKVVLGPYTNWIGPYQIAEKILFWMDKHTDDRVHNFGTWLSENRRGEDSLLMKLCTWSNKLKKRQEYVRIDRYDHWNADHTLAVIIVPLLKALRANKHGSGMIDDCDVPEHLRSTSAPPLENSWDTDDNLHRRYAWFLDEVIWAFEQHTCEAETDKFYDHGEKIPGESLMDSVARIKVDEAGLRAHCERKQHAFMMFGKYFQTLWD